MNAMVLLATAALAAEPATLVVTVTDLRNSDGVALVCVWTEPAGFPTDTAKAHRCQTAPVQDKSATVQLDDLPAGPIAVSVIHDEDLDGALDTTFLMPSEGVGASIGPDYRRLGPPRFADAVFVLASGPNARVVGLTYLL